MALFDGLIEARADTVLTPSLHNLGVRMRGKTGHRAAFSSAKHDRSKDQVCRLWDIAECLVQREGKPANDVRLNSPLRGGGLRVVWNESDDTSPDMPIL